MNAKQRKIADRIRERALLDSDAKLARIEALQRELAADKAKFESDKAAAMAQLADQVVAHNKEAENLRKAKASAIADWIKERNLLEEVNIVREVLLQLELDEDPMTIALNIRKQFGMIIPEW